MDETRKNVMNAVLSTSRSDNKTTEANIADKLDQIARVRPDLTALVQGSRHKGQMITYRQLSKRVARKAGALSENGVRQGDLVLMLEPMSIDLYISILAVFRIGATVLILDAAAGRAKLEHAIERTKPRAVIACGKGILAALALSSVRRISLKFSDGFTPIGWCSLKENGWHRPASCEAVAPDHPALITLTSGTSGTPKMIVRSHRFLETQLHAVASNCNVEAGRSELTSLPVFVLANLASSVTSILPDSNLSNLAKLDADSIVKQIQGHLPDRMLASPLFVEKVIDRCIATGITLPSVKTIITGGGPVFPKLLKKAKSVCPNADLITVYGSTEAEPVSKIRFDDLSDDDFNAIACGAGLPVGRPVEQIKIRILPLIEQDRQLTNRDQLSRLRHVCEIASVPLDAVGEIIVTGNHVVKGYDGGTADAETKILIDGEVWHKTGDIGYVDRLGRLWLTGRRASTAEWKSYISASGKQTHTIDPSFSQCVEAVALSDENVSRAACLTLDDETTLYIETDEPSRFDAWAIKDRLNWGSLNSIKLIRKIPVDSRHSSKVLYEKLAASA
jgi:acyl-CoA synthetase (AMP-forming)/AMP-acid ligase II